MGVRKGNTELRNELNDVLQRRGTDIQRILGEFGVPQLELAPPIGAGE
jgi:hypothetical protein